MTTLQSFILMNIFNDIPSSVIGFFLGAGLIGGAFIVDFFLREKEIANSFDETLDIDWVSRRIPYTDQFVEPQQEPEFSNILTSQLKGEYLEKAGFIKYPGVSVMETYALLGSRNRWISVTNPGTPNEMVFICDGEYGKRVDNIVTLKNYDYDGYTTLMQLDGICYLLTEKTLDFSKLLS